MPSCANSSRLLDNKTLEGQKTASSVVQNQPFTYINYAEILKKYVDSEGKVNYKTLKENRQKLDQFNQSLGIVNLQTYESWSNKKKIAFLINAYNSLTLASIIDHYPTESIRDIPGVWKGRKFTVVGQEMTLDDIEHQILRKQFDEPRIHLGLVCASIGCPQLINEPYTEEALDRQLDQQTRLF
ncbi:MAG: DUF547 domain-containing protein, partial [Nitrososphaeraceae archaeon]|nr:DUF547 domain-containing protein [Nitrososphaeraceae archaeon]